MSLNSIKAVNSAIFLAVSWTNTQSDLFEGATTFFQTSCSSNFWRGRKMWISSVTKTNIEQHRIGVHYRKFVQTKSNFYVGVHLLLHITAIILGYGFHSSMTWRGKQWRIRSACVSTIFQFIISRDTFVQFLLHFIYYVPQQCSTKFNWERCTGAAWGWEHPLLEKLKTGNFSKF